VKHTARTGFGGIRKIERGAKRNLRTKREKNSRWLPD
jgi:hypothetical protein